MLTQIPTIQRMLLTMPLPSHAKAANASTQECFERAKSSVYAHQVAGDDLDECLNQLDSDAQIETEEFKSQESLSSSRALVIDKDAKLSRPFAALQKEPANNVVGHLGAGGSLASYSPDELAGTIVKGLMKRWTSIEDTRVLSNTEHFSDSDSYKESESQSENDTFDSRKETRSRAEKWKESSLDSMDHESQSRAQMENGRPGVSNNKNEGHMFDLPVQPQQRNSFAPRRPTHLKEKFPSSFKHPMEDDIPRTFNTNFQSSSSSVPSIVTSGVRSRSELPPRTGSNFEVPPKSATRPSAERRPVSSRQSLFNVSSMPSTRSRTRANVSPPPRHPFNRNSRTQAEHSPSMMKFGQTEEELQIGCLRLISAGQAVRELQAAWLQVDTMEEGPSSGRGL